MCNLQIWALVLLSPLFWLLYIYNALVRRRERVRAAWSQIDVQLKRRHDLIPPLVETARGYMRHERTLLERVARARTAAAGARDIMERAGAEDALTREIKSLFMVMENYPQLKAGRNLLAIQEELTTTENRIAFARQFYNDEVMLYNSLLESFPASLVAGAFAFRRESFFEMEDPTERRNVSVEL